MIVLIGFFPVTAVAEQDCSMEFVTGIPRSECEVLMFLYNTTGGPNWEYDYFWDTGIPAAEWKGITVENGHVTGISVYSQEKEGTLFPELGNLSYLRELSFGGGNLGGPIPPELGNLAHLEILDLKDTELTSNIPPELANLKSLATLNLGNTKVSGPIPPELTSLRKLIALILRETAISGPIPPGFGDVLSLQNFQLGNTDISGAIPPELGNLRYLTRLDLNDTNLSGSIPPEFGGLAKILIMDLSGNNLTGSIPPELGDLRELRYLYLDNNNLEGTLSPDLGRMIRIGTLNLSHNQLEGVIPPEFRKLENLWHLDISHNRLDGALPPEIGSINRLNRLDLSYNYITSVPPELGNLDNLSYIDLSHNQLSGTIPHQWGYLPILNRLILNDNQLSGPIPPELGNMPRLVHLNLDHNNLSGPIPPELGNMPRLAYLNLDHNNLSGPIPQEIGNLEILRTLHIRENQLSGPIPAGIGNLAELRELRLRGNLLSGSVPVEIMNLQNLNQGSIPNYYHSDVNYNALYTNDPEVIAFMDTEFPGWKLTQTLPPENIEVEVLDYWPPAEQVPVESGIQGSNRVRFTWDPIAYQEDDGGYQICIKESVEADCIADAGITADRKASSLVVSGLNPDTEYYFEMETRTYPHVFNFNAVTSRADGVFIVQTGNTMVTTVPFWNLKPGAFAGMAFSNYGIEDAGLSLTAWDEAGLKQNLPVNPSTFNVVTGQQVARLGTEFFGVTPDIAEKFSWVEVTSDQPVGSFFAFGSSDMKMLDGVVTQSRPSSRLWFTRPLAAGALSEQGESAEVRFSLVNPLDDPVDVTLSLIQDGETVGKAQRTIAGKGMLYASPGELFDAGPLPEDAYLEVETTAGTGVIGFSRVDFPQAGTTLALNAAEPSSVETLYSAQLASGPGVGGSGMETHIRLLNPMKNFREITFTAIANNGSLLAEPVTRTLCGQCVMETRAWNLFAFEGDSAIGSLIVEANAGGVVGDVIFTPFEGIEYAAAMPLQTRPVTEAVFNHIANSDEIYTGLAFFNPTEEEAQITIVAKRGNGTISGTKQLLLGPGERISRTLNDPDMLPGTASQLDGFISISSTQPIICQQLFGSTDLRYLAAVPPSTSYTAMF